MFAALRAPSCPVTALAAVAQDFTPRFEILGDLVLLDVGGLARLFGGPDEIGDYVFRAIVARIARSSPGMADVSVARRAASVARTSDGSMGRTAEVSVAIAPTATTALLMALGQSGVSVIAPGEMAAALGPLPLAVLGRYERLRMDGANTSAVAAGGASAVSPFAGAGTGASETGSSVDARERMRASITRSAAEARGRRASVTGSSADAREKMYASVTGVPAGAREKTHASVTGVSAEAREKTHASVTGVSAEAREKTYASVMGSPAEAHEKMHASVMGLPAEAREKMYVSVMGLPAEAHEKMYVSGGGWQHPRQTHQAGQARIGRTSRARAIAAAAVDVQQTLDLLGRWGVTTLGALAALPMADLSERLGERGPRWQRLARGEDERPLVPWVAEEPFDASIDLEWPIEGLEPLSFVLTRLLEPLSARLERADRGAAIIHTRLRLVNKTTFDRHLQLPAPMRDPKTLRTLMLLDLETHPPAAAVDRVGVLVEPTPGRVLQWALFERAQPSPEQVSTLLARLTALMGEGHVGSPTLVDSWRPGAFEMQPFEVKPAAPRAQPSAPEARPAAPGTVLRRFRLPVSARVRVHEGRPVRVQVDRRGLASGAIVQAAGPWRTSGAWWEGHMGTAAGRTEQVGPGGQAGQVGQMERMGQMEQGQAPGQGAASRPRSHQPHPTHPTHPTHQTDPTDQTNQPHPAPHRPQPWDRDEWDVALGDGTIYRLFVEREIGQWFIEGVID